MKRIKLRGLGLLILVVMALGLAPLGWAADEQSFDVLQIGTHTYRNVTVTTKSKDYIFILHSTGMANIKLSDLSPELREKLGYIIPPPPKSATATANEWAKKSLSKIENPQVKALEQEVHQAWSSRSLHGISLPPMTPRILEIGSAVLLALYLFVCHCCNLICRKTGKKPSVLIWIPVLQMFPLLEAAGMSGWWFVGMFVPGLNLWAAVLWSVKIAKARGKSAGFGILLLLPVVNVFAFLNLAFANGAASPAKEKQRRVEIMTLETA